MAGPMSAEAKLTRGLSALAITAVAALGCFPTVEATPTPFPSPTPERSPLVALPCENNILYPQTADPIPAEGQYLIRPPARYQSCAVQLTNHPQLVSYLEISARSFILDVWTPDLGWNYPYGSIHPTVNNPLEDDYRGLHFTVQLTPDGNYLMEYDFDASQLPPEPTSMPPGLVAQR